MSVSIYQDFDDGIQTHETVSLLGAFESKAEAERALEDQDWLNEKLVLEKGEESVLLKLRSEKESELVIIEKRSGTWKLASRRIL